MTDLSSLVEIVRLPVVSGSQDALVAFLTGNPYFAHEGLIGSRVLCADDAGEVVLVLDWTDREAPGRALRSEAGQALLKGLEPLLSGDPQIAYYGAAA